MKDCIKSILFYKNRRKNTRCSSFVYQNGYKPGITGRRLNQNEYKIKKHTSYINRYG